MRRLLSALCLLVAFASPASACFLITSNDVFVPAAPETFDWDNAKLSSALPAPVLKVERLERLPYIPTDYRERIEACRSGKVSVRIHWPRAAKAKLDQVGFRFKMLTKDSGLSVEDVPVTGVQESDSMRFDFLLFESPYVTNKPLAMKMEVYAVNAKRQRGPARTLVLRAPAARAAEKAR
jgi:hypothetical protein